MDYSDVTDDVTDGVTDDVTDGIETSGNSYIEQGPTDTDLTNTGNNTGMSYGTNSGNVTNKPTGAPDNSVLVIFGIVGGVVLLISVMLLLCILWTRKRRGSRAISTKNTNRRSGVVSTDAEEMLNGPIGFNQVVYGFDDDVGENIIALQSVSHDHTHEQEVTADNTENGTVLKHETTEAKIDPDDSANDYESIAGDNQIRLPENEVKFDSRAATPSLEIETDVGSQLKQKTGSVQSVRNKDATTNEGQKGSHIDSITIGECFAFHDSEQSEEAQLLKEDLSLGIPPPSPCKTDIRKDYINVPKYAKPYCTTPVENVPDYCDEYVNMSDDMKCISKRAALNEKSEMCKCNLDSEVNYHQMSSSCVIDKERENANNSYIAVQDKRSQPPSYDELPKQQLLKNEFQTRPDYANISDQQSKLRDQSVTDTIPVPKMGVDSTCRSNTYIESDMYLPMDNTAERDNEYIPMDNPDTLNHYERNTILKHSQKLGSTKEIKSLDKMSLEDYVNTQHTLHIPVRSSSCDSVYSYADPNILCSFYLDSERLNRNSPHFKSRLVNRSKTFSPADSKTNPFKYEARKKRSKETRLVDRNFTPCGQTSQTQDENHTEQVSSDEKTDSEIENLRYVNIERSAKEKPKLELSQQMWGDANDTHNVSDGHNSRPLSQNGKGSYVNTERSKLGKSKIPTSPQRQENAHKLQELSDKHNPHSEKGGYVNTKRSSKEKSKMPTSQQVRVHMHGSQQVSDEQKPLSQTELGGYVNTKRNLSTGSAKELMTSKIPVLAHEKDTGRLKRRTVQAVKNCPDETVINIENDYENDMPKKLSKPSDKQKPKPPDVLPKPKILNVETKQF